MSLFKKLFTHFHKKQAKSYEGATISRRLGSWGISSAGPNTALSDSLSHLRFRSRDLVRNNPWVANGFRSLGSNLIWCGITPRWKLDENLVLKEEIQQCWLEWTNESDVDGRYDFYGLQLLVAQTLMQTGEALIRIMPQKFADKSLVPLQLQIIEPVSNSPVIYMASIIELFSYNEWYLDDAGIEQPMIPENTLILGATTARTARHYGAIHDLEASAAVRYFPKSWTMEDPSVRYVMVQ